MPPGRNSTLYEAGPLRRMCAALSTLIFHLFPCFFYLFLPFLFFVSFFISMTWCLGTGETLLQVSVFTQKQLDLLLSKNTVSRPVRFTGRPTWRGKIEVNLRCISADCNGIAGGADNRFAPLERDLLSYCDCE
jgi:hypothetical protein